MYKNISDTLYSKYDLKVNLLMFLKDDKKDKLITVSQPKVQNDLPTIYMSSYGRVIIGFCPIERSFDEESKTYSRSMGQSIYFSQRSFYEIDIALTICSEWLRSKNFKYLFSYNSSGDVIGLGASPPYSPMVSKNNIEFIRFTTAVVKDINNVYCEGIALRSHKGAISQFTCAEFLSFVSSMRSYLNNVYGNNLQLLTSAVVLSKMIK